MTTTTKYTIRHVSAGDLGYDQSTGVLADWAGWVLEGSDDCWIQNLDDLDSDWLADVLRRAELLFPDADEVKVEPSPMTATGGGEGLYRWAASFDVTVVGK